MKLTISGLPRSAACPGSAVLPVAATQGEWADMGHSNHAIAETAIKSGDLSKLPEEARALFEGATLACAEVRVAYHLELDTARILEKDETPLEGELTGHIDALILHGDRVTVVDWKLHTSVGRPDRNLQVMGYALCAARIYGVHEVDLVVGYIQAEDDGSLSLTRPLVRATVDSGDLDGWYVPRLRRIVGTVREQTQRYHALGILPDTREGAWCKWCGCVNACPTKQGLIRQIAAGESGLTFDAVFTGLSDEQADELAGIAYEKATAIEAVTKRIKAQVFARAAFRPVPLSNGMELRKVISPGNEYIVDAEIAHAILVEQHGTFIADKAVTRVPSTSKTAIRAALKAGGVKSVAEAERKAIEAMRAKGAAKRTPSESIEAVPVAALKGSEG